MATDGGDDHHAETWKEFRHLVNLAPAALAKFLESKESKAVGYKEAGAGESVGHHSGRRIMEIKKKKKSDLDDADWAHMAKVVGYIKRHLAQGGPEHDKRHSAWRYSLMNWGHDPLKK
jgi:hypothetical protein